MKSEYFIYTAVLVRDEFPEAQSQKSRENNQKLHLVA